MEREQRKERLAWFIPLRLATFVIIFAVVVLWMGNPKFLHLPFFSYAVFTLAFTLFLAFDKRQRHKHLTDIIVILHLVFELITETGIVYATGQLNSPFSALYILTIVSSALVYRLFGTLVLASLSSAVYALIVWLGLSNPETFDLSFNSVQFILDLPDRVFYSVFLHILIVYLTAFMSGYLADRLRMRDRQLADTSLALRKAKLETDDILLHLNSGLLTIDAQGRIVFFNRTAGRILGYREEDIKGHPCEEVFAERMPNLAACLMDSIRSREAHIRREIEITAPTGIIIPIGLSISILTGENYIARGVIAIFSDLTEAKILEVKMRAADRLAAIGELSAAIAHEIRNPLAAISGSVEVLRKDLQLSDENKRLMELIVKESHRLSLILSEFLHYTKIDRPAYVKVDLCHIINDILRILYHHESFNDSIRVDFESFDPVVYVVGDEDLIKQLLLNLAVNACESFEGNSGQLTFHITPGNTKEKVLLLVEDNGSGITEEAQKKIFQPFFSTKKLGTGLGLAIVHRICTALKLNINVHSSPSVGTKFEVEFKACLQDYSDPDKLQNSSINTETAVI